MRFSNEHIEVREENRPQIPADLPLAYAQGEDVPCRDPFILPFDGVYYLYRSKGERGVEVLLSCDLLSWYGPVTVFEKPEGFDAKGCWFWAPECHYYNGNFYIFTSVLTKSTDHRRISVYRAKTPLGPFEHLVQISPAGWDAIDGTLYLDKAGKPWLVFVHEWTCMPDKNGGMAAMPLSDDLTRPIGEPTQLFLARDAEWANNGVTDGPFLYRTGAGELRMIWSNFTTDGYVVGLAGSDNGEVDGNWRQMGTIYRKNGRDSWVLDGGHAMIFRTFDGELCITFHSPNNPEKGSGEFEHVMICELFEENGEPTVGTRCQNRYCRPQKQLLMRRESAPFEHTPLPDGYSLFTFHRGGDEWMDMKTFTDGWFRVCPNWTTEMFNEFYNDARIPADGHFLVRDGSGDIVGHSNIQLNEHKPGTATVHWVDVRPDQRGKRLGYVVSERVLDDADARGIRTVYLTTDAYRVPAIKIYLKLGFKPVMWDRDMRNRWFPIMKSLGYHDYYDENEQPARLEY